MGASTSIKYNNVPIVDGQFGTWAPIGAEQVAGGYTVVMKLGSTNQFTIWSTDANGNYLSNTSTMTNTDSRLTSLESSFSQDLNGDGFIGASVVTVIEALGSTQLALVGNNYYFTSGGSNLSLKYANTAIVVGQFGAWKPIAAEQTAGGYSVVMQLSDTDQYTIWSTDANGNYLSNTAVMSGTDSLLTSVESSFQQDINLDGAIAGVSKVVIEAHASTELDQAGNNYYLYGGSTNVSLKYNNVSTTVGQFGSWTPIAAERIAEGYTVVLKYGSADQYTIWSTDINGNYISNTAVMTGAVRD